MRILMLTLVHALLFCALCYVVATSQARRIESDIYHAVLSDISQLETGISNNIQVIMDGRRVILYADKNAQQQLQQVKDLARVVPGVIETVVANPTSMP